MIVIDNNINTNTDEHGKFGDLAVVSCYFNWCNYKTPARNLNRFIRQCKALGIPLFGIELSLTDNFQTAGIRGWRQFKVDSKNICFQKEALINLCVSKLPCNFTKVAWIDCDVFFDSLDWYKRLSTALDYKKIVQPFRSCSWTDQRGVVYKTASSFFLDPASHNTNWRGHPGYAMACTREYFTKIGLFPYCAIGNGDTIFAAAVVNGTQEVSKYETKGVMPDGKISKQFLQWREVTCKFFDNDYGIIDGIVYHEHHGTIKNRNYWNRYEKYMAEYNFEQDIKLDRRGILEFTESFSQEQRDGLLEYFKNRREDD